MEIDRKLYYNQIGRKTKIEKTIFWKEKQWTNLNKKPRIVNVWNKKN